MWSLMLHNILPSLEPADFKVLKVLDRYLGRFEYVPIEVIESRVRLSPKKVMKSLMKLSEIKAVIKGGAGNRGYRLTYLGLDLLAVNLLAKKEIITHLGPPIGVGKESEIYLAKLREGPEAAIKFYRIGRISFQKVVRVRDYLTDEANWLIRSKTAAEREYKALKDLMRFTRHVPKVFGWSKHAVVMEYLQGVELHKLRDLPKPREVLMDLLSVLRVAYKQLGIVHGDLSEYNVIVSEGSWEPYIIDWPQYLYIHDPRHEDVLRRDVWNLIKFFKRRYGVNVELDAALRYVKGESYGEWETP
ncbi:MAG: serine/threonine protein kinase [Desulfurococcales archaeon]|nr:serine/threonine protein kinase [Desulfurococcales archaeon]